MDVHEFVCLYVCGHACMCVYMYAGRAAAAAAAAASRTSWTLRLLHCVYMYAYMHACM